MLSFRAIDPIKLHQETPATGTNARWKTFLSFVLRRKGTRSQESEATGKSWPQEKRGHRKARPQESAARGKQVTTTPLLKVALRMCGYCSPNMKFCEPAVSAAVGYQDPRNLQRA